MKAIAEFFVLFHKFDAISESNMFLKPSIAFPFLQSKTEVPKMAQKTLCDPDLHGFCSLFSLFPFILWS